MKTTVEKIKSIPEWIREPVIDQVDIDMMLESEDAEEFDDYISIFRCRIDECIYQLKRLNDMLYFADYND